MEEQKEEKQDLSTDKNEKGSSPDLKQIYGHSSGFEDYYK